MREWASLTLLCMSALRGFITDLAFDAEECLGQLEYLLSTLKVKCLQILAGTRDRSISSAGADA